MTYTVFREFADSWAALGLLLIFVGAVLFAFRPGSRRIHRETASIPFRHEDRPAGSAPLPPAALGGDRGPTL